MIKRVSAGTSAVDRGFSVTIMAVSQAGIAQLVERNLAKVEVASSRLVSRSSFVVAHVWRIGPVAAPGSDRGVFGAMAEWLCSGLQSRVPRFDSESRLQNHAGIAQLVERNLAKVEVASSRLVSRSSPSQKGRQGLFVLP